MIPKINPELVGEDQRLANLALIASRQSVEYFVSASAEYRNEIEVDLRKQGIFFGQTLFQFKTRQGGRGVITSISFEPPGRFTPVFNVGVVGADMILRKHTAQREFSIDCLKKAVIIGEVSYE